jgi:hypothetical protein
MFPISSVNTEKLETEEKQRPEVEEIKLKE